MATRDASFEDQRFLSTAEKRRRHVLGVIPVPDDGAVLDAHEILILELLTLGTELSVVARRFGISEAEIRKLAESARGVRHIAGRVVERKERELEHRAKMEDLVGKALDTYEAILEKPEDQKVAAKVAGDILDRDPRRAFTRSSRVEQVGGRGVIDLDAVAARVVDEMRGSGRPVELEADFEEVSRGEEVVPSVSGDGLDLV